MPNDTFIHGLSGEEIISDVLSQIKIALRRDCNLRGSDNYGRGYSGKVTIHLDCFSIDTATVEATVQVKPTLELLEKTPETPQDVQGTDISVDAEIEIPGTPNLDEVRKRSEQGVPVLTTDAEGNSQVKKRNYATPVISGGALDENA